MGTVFEGLSRPYDISRPATPTRTEFGNTIPGTPAVSFVASLSRIQRSNNGLLERYGADGTKVVLMGECLEPAVLPDGVTDGFTAPFVWAKREGTLTIQEVWEDPFGELLDEIVGQVFIATFER